MAEEDKSGGGQTAQITAFDSRNSSLEKDFTIRN
jgi:hypothetical protein